MTDKIRLDTPSVDLADEDKPESKAKGGGPLELKGERYDGMAVFDSATPNSKRSRNQRKGPEVLRQMMKNSAEVQPAEMSYHATGEFRGTRDIYGPLSAESSPVCLVQMPPFRVLN